MIPSKPFKFEFTFEEAIRAGKPHDHVSGIIRSLHNTIWPGEWSDDEPTEEVRRQWEVGLMWEEVFARVLSERQGGKRQAPLRVDGIIGTPDWRNHRRVREFKLSRISSERWPLDHKFWSWEVQLMCYCYMAKLLIGEIIPMFVNGNYKRGAKARSWLVLPRRYVFTQQQLDRNWRMIVQHHRKMKRRGV